MSRVTIWTCSFHFLYILIDIEIQYDACTNAVNVLSIWICINVRVCVCIGTIDGNSIDAIPDRQIGNLIFIWHEIFLSDSMCIGTMCTHKSTFRSIQIVLYAWLITFLLINLVSFIIRIVYFGLVCLEYEYIGIQLYHDIHQPPNICIFIYQI